MGSRCHAAPIALLAMSAACMPASRAVTLPANYGMPASLAAPPPQGTYIRPCAPESSEARESREALATLDRRIRSLGPADDVNPAQSALQELIFTRCFSLVQLVTLGPDVRTPRELQWWWTEGGGHESLSSFVPTSEARFHLPSIVLPADERRDTFAARDNGSALAPLLCAPSDAACGFETAPWITRAEGWILHTSHAESAGEEVARRCEQRAMREPPESRYASFVWCAGDESTHGAALPLGRFRAPDVGWLLLYLHGGGQHRELSAIDLSSGTAWRVSIGRAAAITSLPTDAESSPIEVSAGHVPVSAAREAALLTFLTSAIVPFSRVEPWRIHVPGDFEPMMREHHVHLRDRVGGTFCGPGFDYAWIVDGNVRLDGMLRWSDSNGYIELLIEAAQRALVPSCVSARPTEPREGRLADERVHRELWPQIDAAFASRACAEESARR